MARIDAFLLLGREQGCSDLHFTVGLPPLARLDGDLVPLKYRELTNDEAQSLVDEILDDGQKEAFHRRGAVDLSYASPAVGRFRINVCRHAGGIAAVCRVVPERPPRLADLGLPKIVARFTRLNSGLVLVTGSAGTGKSTTLAAMIEEINRERSLNIITLEDPDVILVGELRDLETIQLAIEASETGHLVLATLHTRGAAQAIDRVIDSVPADAQAQVRTTLADNLKAILGQDLVRAADGRGRRAACEVLVVTPAISQLIREGKTFQIPSTIATSRRQGMQLLDQTLLDLVRRGEVDPDDAFIKASDKREFIPFVTRLELLDLVGAPLSEGP